MKRNRIDITSSLKTLAIALLLSIPGFNFAQAQIRGKVVYQKDNTPAAFASIGLQSQKEVIVSDQAGNFSLSADKIINGDTLVISSVGYETLKIPVSSALNRSRFILVEKAKRLENVTVKSFNSKDELGSKGESVGYFRSWNPDHTGGEIGRIIRVPYSEYKIDKIRFKVSNLCDTCLLMLHMRTVSNGSPDEEILEDSVTMIIHKLTLDDKVPEFDISKYDLTFTQDQIFVSIEVLNCRSKKPGPCTFCFAGTEKGKYLYKPNGNGDWHENDDYTIHLKLFLRY